MCCKTQGPVLEEHRFPRATAKNCALLLTVHRFTTVGTLSSDVGAEVVVYAATDNLTWRGSSSLSEREATRVLALANMAAFDASIACCDAKFTYWLIRPSQVDPAITLPIGQPLHPS